MDHEGDYIKKMMYRFNNDIKNLPIQIRFSKDLGECSLDDIEWAIETIGDWVDQKEDCPNEVIWLNNETVARRLFIFDFDNKQVKWRVVYQQKFDTIPTDYNKAPNNINSVDFEYCIPTNGVIPTTSLEDYDNLEGMAFDSKKQIDETDRSIKYWFNT